MATFIVLPPRELIEHAVAEFAGRLMPGFAIPTGLWEQIVDSMVSQFESTADTMIFVLHREDLNDDGVAESLTQGYGAIAGDRVIEIDSPRASQMGRSREWVVQGVPQISKML